MEEKLKALLEYVKADGRICPMPDTWNELWNKLPDKKRVGNGWEPPAPLILAAWDSPYLMKILRLEDNIRFAREHSALDAIDTFLRSLKPEQWFYG